MKVTNDLKAQSVSLESDDGKSVITIPIAEMGKTIAQVIAAAACTKALMPYPPIKLTQQ